MLSATDRSRAASRSASARRRRSTGASLTAVTTNVRSIDARRRVPATPRGRIAAALARCTRRDRVVLALMLVERLSTSEAADALGISVPRLRRVYGETLAELRHAWTSGSEASRPRVRRITVTTPRLRRAV